MLRGFFLSANAQNFTHVVLLCSVTFELSVGDGECDSASITPGINGAALQVGCATAGCGAQRAGSERRLSELEKQPLTASAVLLSNFVSDMVIVAVPESARA